MGTTTTRKPSNGRTTSKVRPVATFDHLASMKGVVRHVPIYLDSDITEEYERAKADYDRLLPAIEDAPDPRQAAIIERYKLAEKAMESNVVVLHLRRPLITVPVDDAEPDGDTEVLKGRRAYDWLVNHHPATDQQNADSQKENGVDAPYNADTFAPALIAACCDDPVLTAEQATVLIDEIWTMATTILTFNAAMECCQSSQVGMVGKGSGGTRGF